MATEDEDLRDLLARLHAKLRHATAVDAESRQLLATVADDIEGALELRDREPVAAETKLQELAVKFETDHPALAEAMRDLIDGLGKAGI
jgi:hypothetical protein